MVYDKNVSGTEIKYGDSIDFLEVLRYNIIKKGYNNYGNSIQSDKE